MESFKSYIGKSERAADVATASAMLKIAVAPGRKNPASAKGRFAPVLEAERERTSRGEDAMKNWRGKLKLDEEMLTRTPTYYIYRSEEKAGPGPVLDGIYIQRGALGPNPPEEISALFEWDTDHPAP